MSENETTDGTEATEAETGALSPEAGSSAATAESEEEFVRVKKTQAVKPSKEAKVKKEKVKKEPKAPKPKAAKAPKAKKEPKAPKAKKEPKEPKAAKKPPTSGQSGPPMELPAEKLNDKERKVLDCFPLKGDRRTMTIVEMAKEAFPSKKAAQANSWTRNSLRRLTRGGWLDKLERGQYRISEKGRKRLQRVDEAAA